ncbi:MAG: PD-(D/E)XK nuclease family protein [Pirellulales bacterium]
MSALGEIERLSRWILRQPAKWSRQEFLDVLEDLLRSEQLPLAQDETGCVRVLSDEGARNLSAPYVFLAGLAEKAFPPRHHDDCIYSDAERRQLASVGLPLASHALDSRYEMLLFYEVLTRATRRLVLSYPALDPAAQPLTPSPYLHEVEHACGLGRIAKVTEPRLTSVPPTDDVRRVRDFRVRAVARALEGDSALWAQLCAHPATRETAGNVLAALRMSDDRFRRDSFGPFEGMLDRAAASVKLGERFGPQHCWSPSQLEQYAYCPFQFFLSQVLHTSPVNEPALAVDYMERGRLLHWLLSTAHRRLNEHAGGPTSPGAHNREEFLGIVQSLVDEVRAAHGDRTLASGLLEIDARKILGWIDQYYHQHVHYDLQWQSWNQPPRPAHFEVSFGPRRGDDVDQAERVLDESDPLSTLDPFEWDCAGEVIRFAGRIDRIDLGQVGGRPVFSVVDYKSGAGKNKKRTSLQAVFEGNALQLPLYALAAQWLLAGQQAEPFRAAYWHVGGKGYTDKEAVKFHDVAGEELVDSDEWRELDATLRARVRSLVEGIRSGQFPMHSADDKCTGHCPFNTVCRVNQVRSLGKTWRPPGEDDT